MRFNIQRLRHWITPASSYLGIEFTDSAVKLTELTIKKGAPPCITSCVLEPLPKHAIQDGKIVEPQEVVRTLQTAKARLSKRANRANICLPSQNVMVRFMKFPDIPLKELRQVIDFEIKHTIHLPFEDPVYDFVKLTGHNNQRSPVKLLKREAAATKQMTVAGREAAASAEGLFGSKNHDPFADLDKQSQDKPEEELCDVMLVAVPRAMVEEYMALFKQAGIRLGSIEIKAMSLFRCLQTEREQPQGTFLLIDVNETICDVNVFADSQLKISRNVQVAFGEEPSKEPQEDSFSWLSDPADSGDSGFHHACSELAHELERLINFYKYTLNNRNEEFLVLYIAGDVKRLDEIAEYLQNRLSLKAAKLIVQADWDRPLRSIKLAPEAFAASIGLALRGADA
ncbi:Tfp pilus assembly protein, ATPase PilM [Paenibacillus sp. UNCCL117]|uniref:type IV pilus biogenesis protein PilM n=1 Tax=unclassified Paenibacillus TaxID=185978 RepID=UPI00088263B9|nr:MULTISPECIES: pilus assembly protein PilM [unclassified Paenibacillus]SDC46858.1 Tfp pilus assembly protein, ATPase PilM [Paenibacillus sp. cl123]SFW12229.1 Tfp pilus assembly protein, ATPase PilM [Paenibacillus sp. UNCCL117]